MTIAEHTKRYALDALYHGEFQKAAEYIVLAYLQQQRLQKSAAITQSSKEN